MVHLGLKIAVATKTDIYGLSTNQQHPLHYKLVDKYIQSVFFHFDTNSGIQNSLRASGSWLGDHYENNY